MKTDRYNERNLVSLLKELSKANVKFVVCGGVACVLQGKDIIDIKDLERIYDKKNKSG